jgi:PHS family inorganic phosphate transporter-like MFS transporter
LLRGALSSHTDHDDRYGVDLLILLVATFAQAMSGAGFAMNAIVALSVWRFIAGIGIGGDYPTSAVLASEFSSTHIRGRVITAVFASQGWGNFRSYHH